MTNVYICLPKNPVMFKTHTLKKSHTSVIHMHFFNNKGYNHHPHNTLSAHCLEYLI